ncbi:MAG: corrinoid protein [Chloroflexi bacterium]|nr:corrinoid protein [Chloroflexota bacterium]
MSATDNGFSYAPLIDSVLNQDDARLLELVKDALGKGVSPEDIVTSGLQPAMGIVGEKYSTGEFFVPDMLLASRAVSRALAVLKPRLSSAGVPSRGRVVIGTVFGDIHDVGKNLVTTMLEGTGFQVVDLGINIPVSGFVKAVEEHKPDILGMSALVTTTMVVMAEVIKALKEADLRSRVKVIVGGAPVTKHYADYIGADGYGANGGDAAKLCRELVGK